MNTKLLDMKKKSMPSLIGIPISNICEYNCSFCMRSKYSIDEEFCRFIDKTLIVKLAEKIAGKVEYINISAGYGEAFNHPDFEEIVRTLHQNMLKVISYSNIRAYQKNKKFFDNVEIVVLSCNDFIMTDDIKEDLSKRHNCRISCLVDYKRNNLKSILDLCVFCNENSINLELHWLFGDTLLKKNKAKMNMELQEILKNESQYVRLCGKEKLGHIACKDPWRSLYFDMDGNLRKCCIFMESDDNNNLFKKSLEEIWNSPQMERTRDLFATGGHFEWCHGCPIGFGNICGYSII